VTRQETVTVSRSQNRSLTLSRYTDSGYHIFTSTKTKEVVVIDEKLPIEIVI